MINLFSKRKMELAYEILDTDPNSLYQSILFLELYSMEAFRVEELLRHTDKGDPHYLDFVKERDRLLQRIDEEKERITFMGEEDDFDTAEFTDGKHPTWECEVFEGSFGKQDKDE
ncbi:MAG: hypothetical protein CMQ41_12450 [Gammaproteobacteria bacterium]|nr:hypothetical protein [Gammaproteobacteria bacterium]